MMNSDAGQQRTHGEAGRQLPLLARRAVETYVREGRFVESKSAAAFESDDSETAALLSQRAACFVSIKTRDGELRGCIGTIEPARPTLAEEIVINAAHAATRDPRFPPVGEEELAALRYSVDVLFAPEPAEFNDLDPSIYGVIVEDERGSRRGLLLPDIEGVETAAQQVQIAARKAGIAEGERVKLYRFRVQRFRERETRQTREQGA
ncbi:MAG TPA: AmmeMemoRadiSam system protein A [Pyrinomonadaceae bacterium]|nr:AmmeMemoRadiSam system protein A [Pyrinomonadaceae bacterium]